MDSLDFFNSVFLPSTIRKDDGVEGAIFVDTIIIRDSELVYGSETNKIPAESIKDDEFLNALKGVLVFNEHPKDMITAENYNKYASMSIGTIVNAEYREQNNDKFVYGTMRITNPSAIDAISHKVINGGSLGYKASIDESQGVKTQKNLKPNHFCITNVPRDGGVKIFNSNKGEKMEKAEVLEMIKEFHNSSMKDSIIVDKTSFNNLMQVLGARIVDENVKSIFNSKDGLDKMKFLESTLCIKNIFNSEDEKAKSEELEKKVEELEKKNSELEEKLKETEKKEEEKKEEPKENEDDSKKDESDKKEEPKENEGECKEEKKENSIRMQEKEIKNANSDALRYNAVLNAL